MNERSPTRAALLELQDEQRAMREGHGFLDEKCLLLAGEMLRQLARQADRERELARAHDDARRALHAALARHGLQGLQLQPAADAVHARLTSTRSSLMGVVLQQARWTPGAATVPEAVAASPEAAACRRAFTAMLQAAAALAAVEGNLERLAQDYRRSVRRARALQDVLLPELGREVDEIAAQLEELEQQEAIAMRRGTLRA